MRLFLLGLLVLPLAAAEPLPEVEEVEVSWQAALASGRDAEGWPDHRLRALAGTHEFPLMVRNGLDGPIRNVTLRVEAPHQPFHLRLEGPDPADTRPNATKPYAFWRVLPPGPPPNSTACVPCGFVTLHSNHSDDFSGGFEFTAHLFFEKPDGSPAYAASTLKGTIEGGPFRLQPWMIWLIGVTVLAALAVALWMSRRHPPPRP